MEKLATFGAGCFWGVEHKFRQVHGVVDTAVGYMGGQVDNPTYEQVCRDDTGHTEVCQVEYNHDIVSYKELLDVFWNLHNPTQVDRQGPDIGYQYRSVIYYHDENQKQIAEQSLETLANSGKFTEPIATAIQPAQTFWRAEEYHQRYVEKTGRNVC
ncbi:peptide-methionine (S)-S-oxide reductase MsrA [Patescibacteria group bacterium]|nr:peptide-methionine (S)-S-oxide reductase MsrA [Patescibacteria group bacterium]